MMGCAARRRRLGVTPVLVTVLSILSMAGFGAACGDEERSLFLELPDDAAAMRAARFRVRVSAGRCDALGDELYLDEFGADDAAAPTPALAPGDYAITAEAISDGCGVFARGCVDQALPVDGPVTLPLEELAVEEPQCEGTCRWCTDGVCNEDVLSTCGHNQVVFEFTDTTGGLGTPRSIARLEGAMLPRPVCNIGSTSVCTDAFGVVQTQSSVAGGEHRHEIDLSVYTPGGAPVAVPDLPGMARVKIAGDQTFVVDPGGAAPQTVGPPAFIALPETRPAGTPEHTHPVECIVFEEEDDAQVETPLAAAPAFTVQIGAGEAARFCVPRQNPDGSLDHDELTCAAQMKCRPRPPE